MITDLGAWQLATILIGGFGTLAIFSFLVKENPYYRFFEHLYIGIAAGLVSVLTIKNMVWPRVIEPMLGWDISYYPDGTPTKEYDSYYLLYLIPMVFGLFYYFIFSKRYSWLAKLAIGFSLGISGGLAFKGFFNLTFPQIYTSFKPLVVFTDGSFSWGGSLTNIVFVLTLLSVMYYFFFSFRNQSRVLEKVSYGGRWLMMVCCGAYFGSTVMARMALLVERLQFLITDWASALRIVILG